MQPTDRLTVAAERFKAFFEELRFVFLERDDVLTQVALGLLAKEHVLLSGPPGTAKSLVASAVFGRILCEDSRQPSLYARQITESTVHTDLIGPIDFKNLMETGRTEHFTDEGMLGAAHAFLDEVFDGRDMLLRTALNVLQERELKQGTTITRGRIECALMTSNRYISDVLEQSRDTLLAFVDRIAFVGFVPRGFGEPANLREVLERHAGGRGGAKLDALLSLQDVDALQAATDEVVVSAPICEALATFIGDLDSELSAAMRADPLFVPTRYLSTRTAVRCGKILRAACVYRWVFGDRTRPMQVLSEDLAWLRYHLIVAGPKPEHVTALLERERHPNERRQLEIVRTEREIFERCLTRLGHVNVPALDAPDSERLDVAIDPLGTEQQRAEALAAVAGETDVKALIAFAVEASNGGDLVGLAHAGEALNRELLRASLDVSADRTVSVSASVERFVGLVLDLQDNSAALHATAGWLRERAVLLIDASVALELGARSDDIGYAAGSHAIDPIALTRGRLDTLERLAAFRRQLDADPAGATWQQALSSAQDQLAALWDNAFVRGVGVLMDEDEPDFAAVLAAVGPELNWLNELDGRMAALMGEPARLRELAAGKRVGALVRALLRRTSVLDRKALLAQVDRVVAQLTETGLGTVLPPVEWLSLCAAALLRSDEVPPSGGSYSYEGYRAMRAAERRMPIAYTLSEIAMRTDPTLTELGPAQALERIAQHLAAIDADLRGRIVQAELARIGRGVSYLRNWWGRFEKISDADKALRQLVSSCFFDIVWEDAALARFGLELDLLVQLFGTSDALSQARADVDALSRLTREGARALLRGRSDEAWAQAVGGDG